MRQTLLLPLTGEVPTPPIELDGGYIVSINAVTALTGNNININHCDTVDGTFLPVYVGDGSGDLFANAKVALGTANALDVNDTMGLQKVTLETDGDESTNIRQIQVVIETEPVYKLTTQRVNVSINLDECEPVEVEAGVILAIDIPAGFDGTTLSAFVSGTKNGFYSPLLIEDSAYSYACAASYCLKLLPATFQGAQYVKFKSDTAQDPALDLIVTVGH